MMNGLRIFLIILFFIFPHPTHTLCIPPRIRLNSTGEPRLASVVESILNVATRAVLFFPSSADEFVVNIHAESNRSILRGNLQKMSVSVKDSKSSFLKVSGLHIQGSNLQLGWTPLLITLMPFVYAITRPPILPILLGFFVWKNKNKWWDAPSSSQQRLSSSLSFWARLKKRMIRDPCRLDYSLTLSDEDNEESLVIRYALRAILRSLMLNSVLKVAAVAGDTAAMIQVAKPDSSGNLIVPEGSSFQLTELLSATSFDLMKATFSDRHLLLSSQAVLPSSPSSPSARSRLDFTLRTTLETDRLDIDNSGIKQHALIFASPECRFDVTEVARDLGPLGNLLPPVLWIPVGSGAVTPLGNHHRIRRVDVSDGKCCISGHFALHKKEEERSFVSPIGLALAPDKKRLLPP